MKISGKLLTGLILGAGAMFLLDPDRGTRRRALARDRGIRASRKLSEGLGSTARDLRNRTSGAAAELKARFGGDTAGDEVIEERVRSALGRVVSHPHSIVVEVHDGLATLRGPIEPGRMDSLIDTVSGVRGVLKVENRLEPVGNPAGVPGLQGGRPGG